MKRIETIEELETLRSKKAIKVFGNFEAVINNHKPTEFEGDDEVIDLNNRMIWKTECYLGEYCEVYDLCNGYYMFCDRRPVEKTLSRIAAKIGIGKPIDEIEHTIEIYKVVE